MTNDRPSDNTGLLILVVASPLYVLRTLADVPLFPINSMTTLSLFLFGSPRLLVNDQPVELNRRKALALLAYLAVTNQTHSRDALATLFWPESDQTGARGALRRTLSVLNTSLAGEWLDIDRENVSLRRKAGFWLDVEAFQAQLTPPPAELAAQVATWCEAAELYQADFLAGFTLRDCPEFDEWQFFQAEELRSALVGVLGHLVSALQGQGEAEAALTYARRWLSLDSLNEEIHRCLMQLYIQTGQRTAALRQYQACERVLEEELGVAPSEETAALAEQIRLGQLGPDEERSQAGSGRELRFDPHRARIARDDPVVVLR
jgi:DNA-binding SARP family transcriptional activator